MEGEDERTKDKGVYVGVEDDMETQEGNDYDGLDDIWKEMTVALECSKVLLCLTLEKFQCHIFIQIHF